MAPGWPNRSVLGPIWSVFFPQVRIHTDLVETYYIELLKLFVFKRHSTLAAQNANNKELQEARELVKRLEAKQAELVKATDVPLPF